MAAHRPAFTAPLAGAASLALAVLLLASPLAVAANSGRATDVWQRTAQSWALGIVVPNGAELANGALLSWAEVRNITALTRLPTIVNPDGVTYLVLSAEGDDGTVLQAAAGIWPGSAEWSTYSWHITGLGTNSFSYDWVANRSAPSMAPGDVASISMSVGAGAWGIRVLDVDTRESRTWSVHSPALAGLRSGDQEVFALESYTRSASTFEGMGNATLQALFVDGEKVTGGWYVHGGWNSGRSPLFLVGSADPPTFVSLSPGSEGTEVWSYDALWMGAIWNTSVEPELFAYAVLAALVPATFFLGRRFGLGREGGS